MENPLLGEFNTPHGVPPFELIKVEHFVPAYIEAIQTKCRRNCCIVSNTEAPTFENTIEALEFSGKLLNQGKCNFYKP
jgi:peptidyl-dipeptidase Dcp